MVGKSIRLKFSYYSKESGKYFLKRNIFKSYTAESVKFYFGCQHLMDKISPMSSSLLFYLGETMDPATNEVATTKTTIRKFQEFRKSIGIKACSSAAVNKGFKELKATNLLIKTPEEGNSIVNPRYLFRETEEVRKACLNKLLSYTHDGEWLDTNLFQALGIS